MRFRKPLIKKHIPLLYCSYTAASGFGFKRPKAESEEMKLVSIIIIIAPHFQ